MSRIQSILEKAERDGSVRRVRNVGEHLPPPSSSPGVPAHDPGGLSSSLSEPRLASVNVVTGARLDPLLVAALAPSSTAAEQYRALRTRILHADIGSVVNVVMITSPGKAEGKTLTAANLALAMAQDFQRRVCVVDANLRKPMLHHVLGLTEGLGLADVLLGRAVLTDALVTLEEHEMTVLPAGGPAAHPAELLGSIAMRRTIDALRTNFDRVVIDAPATVPLADVGILAPLVDTVILIVRAGVTSKPAIQDAVSAIDEGKLLGIVLNETLDA